MRVCVCVCGTTDMNSHTHEYCHHRLVHIHVNILDTQTSTTTHKSCVCVCVCVCVYAHSAWVWVFMYVYESISVWNVSVSVCVCVCMRERERESVSHYYWVYTRHTSCLLLHSAVHSTWIFAHWWCLEKHCTTKTHILRLLQQKVTHTWIVHVSSSQVIPCRGRRHLEGGIVDPLHLQQCCHIHYTQPVCTHV